MENGDQNNMMNTKRYALLLAAHDSEYVKKVYGGYFNVFVVAFGEEGETWDLYRVVEGEFPNMNELEMYDGFVVSGSPFDAYGNEYWILELCILLQTLDSMQKKILGICFGHQVLCRALGGKVARSPTGWDIGLREIKINNKEFFTSQLNLEVSNHEIPQTLTIIKCHQDEVWELPIDAEVVAFSDKTKVEMFTIGNHILGTQGHPEYTKDILYNLLDRLLNNGSIEEDFVEATRSKIENIEPDRKHLEKICKNFLKGRHNPSYGLVEFF
ncbi:gamma-glutamyl peptidase 5-like [Chenopodium quinoa]|uniref:Glutamine amidotransferase domain-containing protein n=1 Tax=Chenopodium quinoa TaxID=63459 RepID=A0A803M904_CHEQI|nr:gamma-glutamyl peptidase 5-like [Chenopodium quinoa]